MDNTKTKLSKQEQNKKWADEHKEYRQQYGKEWRAKNKDKLKTRYEENKQYYLEKNKEWREKNIERNKDNWSKWYAENKLRSPKRRFSSAKAHAKFRGINWKLTLDEYTIIIQNPCNYCGNKLGAASRRAAGLDRLDSKGCYEYNNAVSCCFVCNMIKGDFLSPEETKIAVDAILSYRESHPEITYTIYKR